MDPLEDETGASVEDLDARRKKGIAEAAASEEAGEESQEELFPAGILDGDKKQLKDLLRKNLPVTTTISMSSASIPLRDGLLDPEKAQWVLVKALVGNVNVVYKREDGEIVEAEIRQSIKPVLTQQAAPEAIAAQESAKAAAANQRAAAEG